MLPCIGTAHFVLVGSIIPFFRLLHQEQCRLPMHLPRELKEVADIFFCCIILRRIYCIDGPATRTLSQFKIRWDRQSKTLRQVSQRLVPKSTNRTYTAMLDRYIEDLRYHQHIYMVKINSLFKQGSFTILFLEARHLYRNDVNAIHTCYFYRAAPYTIVQQNFHAD